MNIIVGNQKGGVGKSTLCFLLANYFANVKQQQVTCLDFDTQLTLFTLWKNQATSFDNEIPYEVINCDLEKGSLIMEALQKQKEGFIFIDVPGNLSDDNLIDVYKKADLIICPFHYDEKTFKSTIVFAKVIREYLNLSIPILFVPNRVKKSVNYLKKEEMIKDLKTLGIITNTIYDWVAMQRQSLFDSKDTSIALNEIILEQIYVNCIKS